MTARDRDPHPPRAWRVHRLGEPGEALRLDTVETPPPGPGEVTLEVAAVGLNFPDLLLCAGRYQERPARPFSPGFEAAGTVVAAGPDAPLGPGDRAIVVPELPNGAMQERLTVPGGQVFPLPDGFDLETAAVLHIAYQTAHLALHRRAGLRAGESVLVHGGAGGVGSAAIQLARAAGATVIATATGPARAAACLELGAHESVDLAEPDADLGRRVGEVTRGRGADVVLDVVGGELFERSRRCVAFEGRIIVLGFTSGAIPSAPANQVLLRNYSVVGLHLAAYRRRRPELLRKVHAEVLRLHESGAVAPRISEVLPFEEAPAGLRMLAERRVVGRVVLRVPRGGSAAPSRRR